MLWGERLAPKAHKHVRLALVFFVAALAFFVVAGGVAALLFFTGSSSVSTNRYKPYDPGAYNYCRRRYCPALHRHYQSQSSCAHQRDA